MLYHLRNLSDKELLQRAEKHADETLVGILLERYHHLIAAVCLYYCGNEEDAEVLAQQVLRRLNIDIQNHKIPSLNNWIFKVCREEASKKDRKEAALPPQTDTSEDAGSELNDDEIKLLEAFFLRKKPLNELARKRKTSLPDMITQLRLCRQKLAAGAPS